METIEQEIEKILEQIRPTLLMDGGGIEFVSYTASTGKVSVRLQGACLGCPMSQITLKMGIEELLRRAVPQVTEVIAVE